MVIYIKSILNYQITNYDCAPTTFVNAISYLFHREEIQPAILSDIYKYTLDEKGTSDKAMIKLCRILNNRNYNLNCKVITNITYEQINDCLLNGGVVILKCFQSSEHYVLITKIDKKYVYLFDPYYINIKKINDKSIKIMNDSRYNRRVNVNRVFSNTKDDFAIGNNKLFILIKKTD